MKVGEIWKDKKSSSKIKIISIRYDNYTLSHYDLKKKLHSKKVKDYIVTIKQIKEKMIIKYPRSLFLKYYEKVKNV